MTLNLHNIELSISQKIDNTSNEQELNTLTKVLRNIKGGFVYTIDTFNNLPLATENVGKLYYVEDEEHIYWSTGSLWFTPYTTKYTLYGWGSVVPDNNSASKSSPVQEITSSTDWSSVVGTGAGSGLVVSTKSDGTVWNWGSNSNGLLGINLASAGTASSPVQEASSSTNWCQVSVGYASAKSALKTDGTLWSWGRGDIGQMGNSLAVNASSPVQEASSSTNWCQVSSGGYTSLAVKTNNTLWGWGLANRGAVTQTGLVVYSSPVQEVTLSTDWCGASADGFHSTGIKTNGTIWAWGQNSQGQVGYSGAVVCVSSPIQEPSSSTNWCKVEAGNFTTHGIKTDGTLWGFGLGLGGRLANNCTFKYSSPVQEISLSTNWCHISPDNISFVGIQTDGSLWSWGSCALVAENTFASTSSPVQEFTNAVWCDATAMGDAVYGVNAIKVD